MRLTANRPKIGAKQVTRLRQDGQQWIARADFQLEVTGGTADQFYIEAPDGWKEPYSVDPSAAIKVVEIPGENRQLVVQPKTAVRGEYRFGISGALEVRPGEPPAAPDILLHKTGEYSRWLVLPGQLKGQTISWETRGLRPAELPEGLASDKDQKDSFTYQIVNQTPRAALRARTVLPDSASVGLADICMAWQADGLCSGRATFDLQPGGQMFCPLNLPDGYELVHLSIDGQPVAPFSLGPGKWKCPLISQRLPQSVDVVFRGVLSDPLRSGPREFSAPSLGNLPVTQTMWTILGPPSLVPECGKDAKTATPDQQQLLRFRNAVAMIASAEDLLPSDDAEETLRWYQIRRRSLTAARSALQNQLAAAATPSRSKKYKRISKQSIKTRPNLPSGPA